MSICTCDSALVKTLSCFNCNKKWDEPLAYHEKVGKCPEHFLNIAICGAKTPSLCTQCKSDGFKMTSSEGSEMFPSNFKVVKIDPCICNDESLVKTLSCFNCNKKWDEQLAYHEKVAKCPEHSQSVAICGSKIPPLCTQCKSYGCTVTSEGSGMFPSNFKVVKGGPCICNDESLSKTLSCFNCNEKWNEKLDDHERISECPEHNQSIAVCGGTPSFFMYKM